MFPERFYYYGGVGAVNIDDERINKWLEEARIYLKRTNTDFYFTATGNSAVFAKIFNDEVVYWVCKDHYQLNLTPEENEKIKFV